MQTKFEADGVWLRRKISVREAAELAGLSTDTFRRRHRNLIRQLSPRRQGVALGDALAIGEAPAKTA
jgi:hypothetical protein